MSESIEQNSAEIIKLIENKCLKPIEIRPPSSKPEENDPLWYWVQGYSSRLKGDFDKAIILYRQGLRLDESHVGLRNNLGVCLMRIGLINRALDEFQSLECIPALINSSICHITRQDYLKALPLLEKVTKIDPQPSFFQLLALALFRAGRVSEALENFQDVLPGESLMEDERNLRFVKDPNTLFPFKVGEIATLGKMRNNSGPSTRCSGKNSLENSLTRGQNFKKKNTKKKILTKKNFGVDYPNKSRQALATFEDIIEKKRIFDRMIRIRHNTIVETISTNFPLWKYDGFVQQKLENAPRFASEDFEDNIEIRKKIEKIHEELSNSFKTPELKPVYSKKIITKRLNERTLSLVLSEFQKEPTSRDYVKLEKILKHLPFFSKFPGEIRFKLLKSAVYKQYECEEIIIRQGEVGDSMFVILSGSILIVKKSPDYGNIELIINSMYDGETFGELALLSEGISDNIKRSATCVAGEKTMVLAISKQDYKRILLDEMQNDITGKVLFFKSLPFFEDCNSISLIPLASNIEPVLYKIDQVIIELGEKPRGLYIIYKGRCSLYWEGYVAKPPQANPFSNIKIRPKTPKVFKNPEKHRKNNLSGDFSNDFQKAKPYLPKNLQDRVIQKDRILCSPLKEGDFFGGRALIEGLLDTNSHHEHQRAVSFELISADPAKFSVVAESAEVKVFILTKKHFPLLSEEILNKLKVFLTKTNEIDCPKQWSDDFLRSSFVEWSKFKQNFINDVELENYMTKHKDDAPALC
jgi:CRP-like cAMP-binding protein